MDVYTTSFNVYPFAVPNVNTSIYSNTPSKDTYINRPYDPYSNQGAGVDPYYSHQHGGYPSPYNLPPPPSSAPPNDPTSVTTTTTTTSAVHRHHSTNSGIEAVWEHLHRLTLQAMATFPGTHVSFSRTSSTVSSEDSLTLFANANSSNPNLVNPSNASNTSLNAQFLNNNSNGGGGTSVLHANANAALANGPHTRGTAFNFTITGSNQATVMLARGLILRESPVQNRSVIRVARSEILEPATVSAVGGGTAATGTMMGRAHSKSNASMNTGIRKSNEGLRAASAAAAISGPGGESSVPMPVSSASERDASNGSSPPRRTLAPSSGAGGGGALKSIVIQRLDEISAQTLSNISVLKTSASFSSSSSSFYTWPNFSNGNSVGVGNGAGVYGGGFGSGTANVNATSVSGAHGGNFGGANAAAAAAGLEGEKTCELIITGVGDTVDRARLRLLVMLDELSGLHAEQVDIDYKLHGIIAGKKRRAVQQIQEDTATNIYFPPLPLRAPSVPTHSHSSSDPSSQLMNGELRQGSASPPGTNGAHTDPGYGNTNNSSSGGNGNGVGATRGAGNAAYTAAANVSAALGYNPNIIWITGEFFNVGRARDALYQLAGQKVRSKTIISRDTAILSRKLDWMLTNRPDDLKTIQRDNGTYITFPAIGSAQSVCTIYGDSRISIERTVRAVMLLASQFYIACVWLLPLNYNVLVPSANGVNPAAMGGVLRAVASRTGAEVVCKSGTFEMHGLESEVRAAAAMVLELDFIRNFQTEIRFQLELATEHREFISGKKNGKLNKIMSSTSVKIKFESLNEHNFLIDVSGQTAQNVLRGLTLLQDELPAELAFHVPEAYHKRIIGVAGRSIQRIMKKYGVYVKFNSADEMRALALDDEENVLARTPAKNAVNLEHLRASVMELVPAKDKDFVTDVVPVPRRYHRALFGEKSIFLRDIEGKTNCKISFPGDGLDIVTIFGPESQVHQAGAMLLDHVPFEAELTLPHHPDLLRVGSSTEFLSFSERIKRDLQISIVPPSEEPAGSLVPATFKFHCQRSNCDCLSPAREALDTFLATHGLNGFPSRKLSGTTTPAHSPGVVGGPSSSSSSAALPQPGQFAPGSGHVFGNGHIHRRVDSFTDAFPHFNSRLLSTPLDTPDGLDRRIRMATSTPDVKALFNSPSQRYRAPEQRVQEQDEFDNTSFYSRSSMSSVTTGNGLREYPAPLNDFASVNEYTGLSEYQFTPTIGAHGLPPPRSLAHADDAYKRGSDSLIEAKLREKIVGNSAQRNANTRAQSLDLTSLGMSPRTLGTSTAAGSTTIDEDSGDQYDSSSPPQSSMMPTFPSVNDPPNLSQGVMGTTKPRRPLGMVASRSSNNLRPVLDTDAATTADMHSMFKSMNLDSPIH